MSQEELNTRIEEPVYTAPKVGIKQKAKAEAMELAAILYDIYTKEKTNGRVKSGQNNDNVS